MEIKNQLQIEAIEKETREFICPCCNAKLQFRARINISSVGLAETREDKAARDGREVSYGKKELEDIAEIERNKAFLDFSKKMGVFDAFNQALEGAKISIPKNPDSYFLKWLKNATKIKTPQFALRQCLLDEDLEAGGDLELFGYQNVCAVLQNGDFKIFIPRQLVNGEPVETLAATYGGITKQETANLQIWIRTRFGYVEKSSEFSKELRKFSVGGFQV